MEQNQSAAAEATTEERAFEESGRLDHDQLFKEVLKRFIGQFVELFFPKMADRIDFSSVEWIDKEVFTEAQTGNRRFLDLVAKVRVKEPPTEGDEEADQWIILIHIEVEWGGPITQLRPRMYEYYQTLTARERLPIFPIGLFLRVGLDGVGWDVHEVKLWEESVVSFRYAYVGLPALDAQEYVNREQVLSAALAALMKVSPEKQAALKLKAASRIAHSTETDQDKLTLFRCIDQYMPLEDDQRAEFEKQMMTPENSEVQMMGKTIADIGYERGKVEGKNEGKLEGQQLLLETMLIDRFGPLKQEARMRITQLGSEEIAEMTRKLFKAESLDDLGLRL